MTTLQTLAVFITILALIVSGVFLTHRHEGKNEKSAGQAALLWKLAVGLGFSGYLLANSLALDLNLR